MTDENPPRRRRRTPPRKKALTRAQAEQMVTRYDHLLEVWLGKLTLAAKKVELYRRKLAYYREREASLDAVERQAMQQALADAAAAAVYASRLMKQLDDFGLKIVSANPSEDEFRQKVREIVRTDLRDQITNWVHHAVGDALPGSATLEACLNWAKSHGSTSSRAAATVFEGLITA